MLSQSRERTSFTPTDPLFPDQWYLSNTGQSVFGYRGTPGEDINVIPAWNQGFTGRGVVIGVTDDGLQGNHPDLFANYRPDLSYDFIEGDTNPFPGASTDSHGTAVAGIAAGRGGNGLGITGVAPEAGLAGLRFLGDVPFSGTTIPPMISWDAYEASVLSYRQDAIDIYNNSWGPIGIRLAAPGPLTRAAIEQGVRTGRRGLGNIYVFSGGNDRQAGGNVNYDGYANSRYTIAVAAVDANGVHTRYSTPGAAILVSAPSGGTPRQHPGITTTDFVGTLGYNPLFRGFHDDGDYADLDYTNSFSGTSAAAPIVSGVVALMLEADASDANGANLTWRDVQHILVRSARKNDPTHPDWVTNGGGFSINHNYGFGVVDADRAVRLAQNWTSVTEELSIMSEPILVNQTIPDNTPLGVISTFTVADDISLEWVEVDLFATHRDRGDLEIVLTSPNGTQSVLAEERNDSGDNYDGWTFTSARHWGESSKGTWTLSVADVDLNDIGTLDSWNIQFSGVAPQNQRIDLVGSFFDILPTAANAGESVTVDLAIQNSGIDAAGPFNVSFYLSRDGIITTTDFLLFTGSTTGVAGIDFERFTTPLTLPPTGDAFWAGDGLYYIGMIVDSGNVVPETNENNNRNVGLLFDYDVININNTSRPNLVGSNFNLFPEPLNAGNNFTVEYTIQNTGSTAGPFNVSFYLSTNDFISNQDLLLQTVTINGVSSLGSTGRLTTNLSLPSINAPFWTGDGTYYVGMIIDSGSAVAETNENDNSNVGLAFDSDEVVINNTVQADLSAVDFDLTPEPSNAGGTTRVDFTIQNTGRAATGAYNVAFYLSADSTINTQDVLLNTFSLNSLPANTNTGDLFVNLTLPGVNAPAWSKGDGTYYVGMVIDSGNAVTEVSETNNSNTGFLLDYDDVVVNNTRGPDLSGTLLNAIPEPLNAGDRVAVDYAIQNTGATAGAFTVSFYLSTDNTILTSDVLLGTTTITGMNASSNTGTLSTNLLLPGINDPTWTLGDGTYYIGMIVDSGNAITELNEANNSNIGELVDYDGVAINRTTLFGTDDEDTLTGSSSRDFLFGSRDEDDLFGGDGNDELYGDRGDDDILGEAGDDILYGGRGDDFMFGGTGNDVVQGDWGDDVLWGIDFASLVPGLGEIDLLTGDDSTTGNFGADFFVLGDRTATYYSDGVAGTLGASDYAIISDFDPNMDMIQLRGTIANYQVGASPTGLPSGIAIYEGTELIAIVQQATSLDLTRSYFRFV